MNAAVEPAIGSEGVMVSRRTFARLSGLGVATALAAGVLPPAVQAQAQVLNLLANPSFDQISGALPTQWTAIGGVVTSTTSPVHSSGRSVLLDDNSAAGGCLLRSDKVTIQAGAPYTAEVWAQVVSGTAYIYLEYWNSSGTRLAVFQSAITASTVWKRVSTSGIAPDGATSATLLCYLGVAGVGSAYFDDAAIHEPDTGPVTTFPLVTPGHPRLYFTSDTQAALIDRTADSTPTLVGPTGAARWGAILTAANAYRTETSFTVNYAGGVSITYPLPPEQPPPHNPPPGYNGAYPYWTEMARQLQYRLETLSLAYALSPDTSPNRADYLAVTKSYLNALATWDVWSDPAFTAQVTSLDTAYLVIGIACAYDLVHDQLTVSEQTSITATLDRLGLVRLWAEAVDGYDHERDDNISMMRAASLAAGAAVVHGANARSNKYLTTATNNFHMYLERRRTSGTQEGFLYTSLAVDNIVRANDQLQRVTGLGGVLDDAYLNETSASTPNLIRWCLSALVPGGRSLAPISDSTPSTFFPITMAVVHQHLGSDHAAWYLKQSKPGFDNLAGFIYGVTFGDPPEPSDVPTAVVAPGIGWATVRSGWSADSQLLTLVGNNSQAGHNHRDQASLMIGTNNTWAVADPGYRSYTDAAVGEFTTATGHTTIYVDDQPQSMIGGGILSAGILSNSCSYMVCDATAAYQSHGLTSMRRFVVAVPGQYYFVHDRITAPTPHTYQWRMYNGRSSNQTLDGTPFVAGSSPLTRTGSVFSCATGTAQVSAHWVSATSPAITIAPSPAPATFGPTVSASSGAASTSASFNTVLQVAPTGAILTPVQAVDHTSASAGAVTLTRPDGSVDRIAVRNAAGTLAVDGAQSDGNHLLVSMLGSVARQYAATYATTLTGPTGALLLSAQSPCSISAQLNNTSDLMTIRFYSPTTQNLSVHSSLATSLHIDGANTTFTHDAEQQLLTFTATPGYHDATIG